MCAYLQNAGSLAINGVSAEISTSDTHVVWPYNRASSYGNMAGGAVVANADDFDFVIDPDTPDGHLLHFDLDITSSTGGFWEVEFDVPVSYRSDIAVNPPAFTFFIPPNSSASSALGIHNPGGALNWNLVVGVNPTIWGQWNMHYDWGCVGAPGSVVLTFAPDHTFVSSSGASGTWSMAGSQITWVYTNGTSYTGWIAGEYMAGAMRTVDNSEGCWNVDRVFADVVPLVSGDLTDSGEPAPPGCISTSPAPIGANGSGHISPKAQPASEPDC